MPDLTRQEKTVLLFLAFSFVVGLGANTYKKVHSRPQMSVEPFALKELRAQSEELIGKYKFVNINSAEVNELSRLQGIGGKLAQRIIDYRLSHGLFNAKEELLEVPGIGPKKFESIKDNITLK